MNACPTNCTLHEHPTPRGKDDRECGVVDCDAATPLDELLASLEHLLACDGQAGVRPHLGAHALEALCVALHKRFGDGYAIETSEALIAISHADSDTDVDAKSQ